MGWLFGVSLSLLVAAPAYSDPAKSHDPWMVRVLGTNAFGQPTVAGSGFIITSSGYALTAWHVIDPDVEVALQLQDGGEVTADVVDTDRHFDLALLRVRSQGQTFPYVTQFGDARAVRPGTPLSIIGNPEREGKVVPFESSEVAVKRVQGGYITLDSFVPPGYSGGAAVDSDGRVVGVVLSKDQDAEARVLPILYARKLTLAVGVETSTDNSLDYRAQVVELQQQIKQLSGEIEGYNQMLDYLYTDLDWEVFIGHVPAIDPMGESVEPVLAEKESTTLPQLGGATSLRKALHVSWSTKFDGQRVPEKISLMVRPEVFEVGQKSTSQNALSNVRVSKEFTEVGNILIWAGVFDDLANELRWDTEYTLADVDSWVVTIRAEFSGAKKRYYERKLRIYD